MARSINDIYQLIVDEKDNQTSINTLQPNADNVQTLLSDLTSQSRVADWRLWAYITAVAQFALELLFDAFKSDVETIAANSEYGTSNWWQDQVLKFQFGDNLEIVNGQHVYNPVNEANRVVTQAAIQPFRGVVNIKAAKTVGSDLAPLSATELQGLIDYANEIAPAGVNVLVISAAADLLKLIGDVYYDAKQDLNAIQTAVEAAIDTHLKTSLGFNGTFQINRLICDLKEVPGVVDIVFNDVQWDDGINGFRAVVRIAQARAGYFKIDPATPLSNSLTYLAADV